MFARDGVEGVSRAEESAPLQLIFMQSVGETRATKMMGDRQSVTRREEFASTQVQFLIFAAPTPQQLTVPREPRPSFAARD